MTMFYKISNGMAPSYLPDHIPARSVINISLRSRNTNPPFSRTNRYDNRFFPFCIQNWNNLNDATKSLPSLTQFKKRISLFVRPKGTSFYDICDNFGTKVLTKIRVFPTCEIIDFPTALTVQALYALAALMTKLLHIIAYAARVTIH